MAGFRGTVRYASINAHKNKVIYKLWSIFHTDCTVHSCNTLPVLLCFILLVLRKWVDMTICGLYFICLWSSWWASCPGGKSRTKYVLLQSKRSMDKRLASVCIRSHPGLCCNYRNRWEIWRRRTIIASCSSTSQMSLVFSLIISPIWTTSLNQIIRYWASTF